MKKFITFIYCLFCSARIIITYTIAIWHDYEFITLLIFFLSIIGLYIIEMLIAYYAGSWIMSRSIKILAKVETISFLFLGIMEIKTILSILYKHIDIQINDRNSLSSAIVVIGICLIGVAKYCVGITRHKL